MVASVMPSPPTNVLEDGCSELPERHHSVYHPGLDGCHGHAEDDTGLGVLRQNLRALLFHQAEPAHPVRAHPGHDHAQGTIGIEVRDGPEQVIHRWFTIIFWWVVQHQEARGRPLARLDDLHLLAARGDIHHPGLQRLAILALYDCYNTFV